MIKAFHVSKRFGRVVALDDVSVAIARGERVALVGPNGSGKTTLLRAALGLVRVEGHVLVAGVDVARQPEAALLHLAHIPQIAPPLDAPLVDVLRAWSALRKSPIEHALARAERLGAQLRPRLNTRFRDLSGGMKQKVLAAMALASGAPILVCDEPTASLDEDAREVFFDEVNALPAPTTVVVCSHRADEVRALVRRVVELREGKVVRDTGADAYLAKEAEAPSRGRPALRLVVS